MFYTKNRRTIIIDNFLGENKFKNIKEQTLLKLKGKNLPEKWFLDNQQHSHSSVCLDLIEESKKYYNFSTYIGYEFWTQNNSRPLNWHYDKDELLWSDTGIFSFPICSIVYYVSIENLKGGKIILDEDSITPKEDRLIIFPPKTFHFVEEFEGKRTSILVNPWNKVPKKYY